MRKIFYLILIMTIMLLSCNVFAKYIFTRNFYMNINSNPFYFNANVNDSTVDFDGNEGQITLNILNNDGTNYSMYDILYEISLEETSNYKFSIENENVTDNKISKVLSGNGLNLVSYNLKFSLNENANINLVENAVLKVRTKEPYTTEISIPLTICFNKDNILVSVDSLKGTFNDTNDSSTHTITVSNKNSIPVTFNINAENTSDLIVSGGGQDIVVPANSEVSTTITLTAAKSVYLSYTSPITIITNVVSPCEFEAGSHTIEISTYGSSMRDIITKNYTINTTTPDFSQNVTTTANSGVFTTTDSSGTAYYFRGVVSNNYVSFANNLWRIMRVNGNGTIRLILDTPINSSTTYNYTTSSTNSEFNGGPAETAIETWYKNNLVSYNSYINQNTLFLHDRRTATESTSVFRGWERIFNVSPTINTSGIDATYLYSKSGNSNGNGYLTYPIALATAEELMFAGATVTTGSTITAPSSTGLQENSNFYIANDVPVGVGLWTMTPFSKTAVMCFKTQVGFFKETPSSARLLKPVIEINATNVYKGNGTQTDPFVIFE